MSLKSSKLLFCGKERRFDRCPNKVIKEYADKIEDIQEKAKPLTDAFNELAEKINRQLRKIERKEEKYDSIKSMDDPDDSDLRDSIKLLDELEALDSELDELVNSQKEKSEEFEKENEQLMEELESEFASFASVIFKDFNVEDWDDADPNDILIAPHLAEFYRLSMGGNKQSVLDKRYTEIVKEASEQPFQDERSKRRR